MKTFLEFLLEDMSLDDARAVFGIKGAVPDKNTLTSLYRKLSMKNHPDRGGSNEKMSEINQAKQVLIRNIGRSSGGFSPVGDFDDFRGQTGEYTDSDFAEKKKQHEHEIRMVADILNLNLSRFMPSVYQEYIEGFFNQKFTLKEDFEKASPAGWAGKTGHRNFEFANADRDIVFELKIYPRYYSLDNAVSALLHNNKNLGSADSSIEFLFRSNVYINGKKQVIQKELYVDTANSKIFRDPSILLPKARMDKLSKGEARKNSPLKKRDFEAMFTQKFGGKNEGNGLYSINFGDFVVLFTRNTILKMGMYRLDSIKKKSTSEWMKWSREDYIRVPSVDFIIETQKGFDFIRDSLTNLKKDGNVQKFVDGFAKFKND